MTERSFKDAYGVLQRHAQTLREQAEPNIDDLLTIVKESVEAYGVCKTRIDAVEAALKAALDGAGIAGAAPGPSTTTAANRPLAKAASPIVQPSPPSSASFDNMDNDIPF
jgi:exodeoxyribonuclease VII small subunit